MTVIRAAQRLSLRGRRNSAPRAAAKALSGTVSAAALCVIGIAIWSVYHPEPITVLVKRQDLVLSLCRVGAVESADTLDVKNRVRGRRTILHIVRDGSHVRRGELLVRLDSTSVEEALMAEREALAKTETAVVRSSKDLEAARHAIDEYGGGTYERQRLQTQSGILEAQRALAKTEHNLLQIQIMYRMAFVSRPHVEQMELAVEKAQSDLAAATLKKDVLERFTQLKVQTELASKRDILAARLKSEESMVRDQTARIARLEEDLQNCEMLASRDGMVVYAESTAGANQPATIYEGATVRQYQTLVHLANLARMQVRFFVPQTALSQVRRGQRAIVRVLDQELHGKVASVADRPEPIESGGEDLKQFAVVVAFDGRGERLKPGLTAEVEILVDHRKDALVIPLLCIVDDAGKSYVWVSDWPRVTRREIVLGLATDALVEVIGGLDEGETVLLNPQQ